MNQPPFPFDQRTLALQTMLARVKRPPTCPDFTLMTSDERELIGRIAIRAADINKRMQEMRPLDQVHEPNFAIISLDIAVAHAHRKFKLREFLEAEEFSFMAEVTAIEKNIVRERHFLHSDVRLRFAQNGATHA